MHSSQSSYRSNLFFVISFLSGTLFAFGLGISGMTNPKKVIGFLDITGEWDPDLLFVMVGAISVYSVVNFIAKRRLKPFLAPNWSEIPTPGRELPWRARAGNVLFGAGWGLAGYCPGPVFASLPAFHSSTWIFGGFMIVGFLAWEFLTNKVS